MSEFFLYLGSNLQIKVPNHSSEYFVQKGMLYGGCLAPLLGDLNKGEKLSEIKPPLVCAEAVEPNAEVVDFGAKTVDPCTGPAGSTTTRSCSFFFF